MFKRIKEIDFVFENCEVIALKKEFPRIFLYGMSCGDGSKNIHVKKAKIVFNAESVKANSNLVSRIIYCSDLTHITINVDGEDTWYSIFMPWNDEHDEYNTYQKSGFGDSLFEFVVNISQENIDNDTNGDKHTIHTNGNVAKMPTKCLTVNDLYNWAYMNNAIDLPIGVLFQDEGGMYQGDTWDAFHDRISCSIEKDDDGKKYVCIG